MDENEDEPDSEAGGKIRVWTQIYSNIMKLTNQASENRYERKYPLFCPHSQDRSEQLSYPLEYLIHREEAEKKRKKG